MKTCDTITAAGAARQAGGAAGDWGTELPLRAAAGDEGVVFGCPECGSLLQVARAMGEAAGECPSCGCRVVAPQPEFGCRAMLYRDWLRLQECGWPGAVDGGEAVPGSGGAGVSAGAPVVWTGGGRRRGWLRGRRTAVLLGMGLVMLGVCVWWVRRDVGGGGGGRVTAGAVGGAGAEIVDRGLVDGRVGPAAVRGGPPAAEERGGDAGGAAGAGGGASPLALVLNRALSEDTVLVVQASRAHSFARSAPAAGSHLCLKLTDPDGGGAVVRVYVALDQPAGVLAQRLLPWGSEHRVRVRLQWREGGGSPALTGHWVVESLEDAGPVLSLVP